MNKHINSLKRGLNNTNISETGMKVKVVGSDKINFIEQVINYVHKYPEPREFICNTDMHGGYWGDKITWNCTNFTYYDRGCKTNSIIIKNNQPNGIGLGPVEGESLTLNNLKICNEVIYTKNVKDIIGTVTHIDDTTITINTPSTPLKKRE